jgi:glycerol 3-phosphatase-1
VYKGSDELTGNDSVVGSPVPSRPGSPGAQQDYVEAEEKVHTKTELERRPSIPGPQTFTLEGLKKALAGNAQKKPRGESSMDD